MYNVIGQSVENNDFSAYVINQLSHMHTHTCMHTHIRRSENLPIVIMQSDDFSSGTTVRVFVELGYNDHSVVGITFVPLGNLRYFFANLAGHNTTLALPLLYTYTKNMIFR